MTRRIVKKSNAADLGSEELIQKVTYFLIYFSRFLVVDCLIFFRF